MNFWEIKEIYSIVFWGRSGSYLLHSLFDGHPSLLVLPVHNWSDEYRRLDHLVASFKQMGAGKFRAKAFLIVRTFPFLTRDWNEYHPNSIPNLPFRIVAKLGDQTDGVFGAEEAALILELEKCLEKAERAECPLDRSLVIKAIHYAYAQTLRQKKEEKGALKIVLSLHVTSQDVVQMLKQDFSISKFIVTVREPSFAFDSHLYHHFYEYQPDSFLSCYGALLNMFYQGSAIPKGMNPGDVIAVRFEDIHCRLLQITKALAKWIGIPWDDCLRQSTIDGKIWWYNRRGAFSSGVNPFLKEGDYKIMTLKDLPVIQFVLRETYKAWEYSATPCSLRDFFRSLLIPLTPFQVALKRDWSSSLKRLRVLYSAFKIIAKNSFYVFRVLKRKQKIIPLLQPRFEENEQHSIT